jgi:hypothetical protein
MYEQKFYGHFWGPSATDHPNTFRVRHYEEKLLAEIKALIKLLKKLQQQIGCICNLIPA